MRRDQFRDITLFIFALPLVQFYNMWKYAKAAQRDGDQSWYPIARMMTFIPIIGLTFAAWASAWIIVLLVLHAALLRG
jgi:hypothetical protein